ncbi:MAG: hypothetical protein EXS08_01855 [Planctomycetes bacterium]|nr:hypothetical protein [Planctomycetota bacterium]
MRILVLALAGLASSCTDNVTCVFAGSCNGGPGPISENQAVLPVDGEWVLDGPPDVSAVFPSGIQNPGSTPIVIVFNESMAPRTVLNAVEVVPLAGPGQPVFGLLQQLVSDGRVLVLLPVPGSDLAAGDYSVRLGADALVTDLTGQELNRTPGAQLGAFTVATAPPVAPRLVTTFPADNATGQSETSELVTVFDRPVQASSVNVLSFDVKVGGVNPPNDPAPTVLRLGAQGIPDTRVFLYRSVDVDGVAVPLGKSASVTLNLSPATSAILDTEGDKLVLTAVDFTTLAFSTPLGASLLSDPNDAIGLANLTNGDPEELTVEVELDAAQTNDSVDLFLFGKQRSNEQDPPLIALQRPLKLTAAGPISTATFLREDIALQLSERPDDVRFEDGSLTFAFRLRRGSLVTPLRVLDLDPNPDTIQDPLLDTTQPTVSALAGSTVTSEFRSDLRGLSLAGQADERVRSVAVETPLGNNGVLPVVGSDDAGFFLAAPVAVEVVAGGSTTFQFSARDEALNSTAVLAGTFFQFGVLGSSAWTPGASVEIEVFDEGTLATLANARVLVHSDQGNGTDFPFVQAGTTLADGKVTLATAGAPSVGAIVTVVLTGYDLFTLHGVPTTHLSVPLHPLTQSPARSSGVVTTSNPAAVALVQNLDLRFDDSRRGVELVRGFEGVGVNESNGVLTLSYGPQPIRARRLGARSFYAGDFSQTEAAFSASQLLQAFSLSIPFAPAAPGAFQVGNLTFDFLLFDTTAPPADAAQALPPFTLHVDPANGVDLARLFPDPDGAPQVSVDVLVPGLPGSIAAGLGLAFEQSTERWTIRAAQPGAITAAGSLGSSGAVDTDPFVRAEALDLDGNTSGVRPRLSTLLAAGPTPELQALAVPTQLQPLADDETGAQAFTVRLRHALDDSRTEGGLYRVDLNDASGRGWSVWRFDEAGTADVLLRVVDVADAGAVGLADGPIASTASAFAWNGLDPADFLWTDLERRFELFSRAETVRFFKPLQPPARRGLVPGSSSRSSQRRR